MAKFSSGKYAQFISDRSGMAFPYQEMVVEWTGARVHTSEFEPKSPQVSPKPHGADPQALEHARPRSPSIPSPGILKPNPLSMNATTTATVTLDNCQLQVGDAVTFLNVTDNSVGGVINTLLSPFAILATNMTDSSTTIVCDSTSQFPSSGYVFIESFTSPSATDPSYVPEKNFEIIKYDTNTTGTQTLSGLTRATNAPTPSTTLPIAIQPSINKPAPMKIVITPLLLRSIGDFFLLSSRLLIRSLISSGSLMFFDTSIIVSYFFFLFFDS